MAELLTDAPVMAATAWASNAELIADVARLGYLRPDDVVLDPTYGRGTFWKVFRPGVLVASDLDPALSPSGESVDFTALPHADRSFDAVVFDPPYKLNGTPTANVDARYGVHVVRSREDRHKLMLDGLDECARVLKPGGFLLAKCQDQVNGGKVRWQTDLLTRRAEDYLWLEKVDALHFLAYRPQPEGTTQEHARRNHSTLLVFRKPKPRPGGDWVSPLLYEVRRAVAVRRCSPSSEVQRQREEKGDLALDVEGWKREAHAALHQRDAGRAATNATVQLSDALTAAELERDQARNEVEQLRGCLRYIDATLTPMLDEKLARGEWIESHPVDLARAAARVELVSPETRTTE